MFFENQHKSYSQSNNENERYDSNDDELLLALGIYCRNRSLVLWNVSTSHSISHIDLVFGTLFNKRGSFTLHLFNIVIDSLRFY